MEERSQCWLPCLCTFYLILLGNVFTEPRLINSLSLDIHQVTEICMSPSSKYRCYRHITPSYYLHGSLESELKSQPSTLVTELSLYHQGSMFRIFLCPVPLSKEKTYNDFTDFFLFLWLIKIIFLSIAHKSV